MNKKLTAILTLVCFLFTLMPVAAFAEEKYLVTMTVASEDENGDAIFDDNSGGTTTGSGLRYTLDEEVTVSITPNLENGYCAAQWASEDLGMNISAINQKTSHTFTMPEKNVTIAITFVQHSFTAHKNNGDGTHDVHCFYCGKVQTASENCVDVHSGGDGTTPPDGYCDKCSTRIPGKSIVQFESNRESAIGEVYDQIVDTGDSITLPANNFTLDGHTFQGWATESTATHAAYQPSDTYTVNADTTFYAIWNDNAHIHNYETTWSSHEDGHWYECECGDRKDFAVHSGPEATATTPQTCTVCGYEIAPATGYTLTLNYAITGSSGAQIGTGSKTATGIAPGTVVDLSEHWPSQLTTQGSNGTTYYFRAFSYDANGGGSFYNSVTVSENTVMYASWVQQNMVTVEFDTNDGAMSYKRARAGTTYTISDMNSRHIPVRAGYEFVGWSLADDGMADSGDTLITADCTLYAVWQQYLPSYDDSYYDPPPASIPINVGGDYDAILRDDVVIVRGDDPISGTLDLGKTDAVAIRLPADALEVSTGEGNTVIIKYPGGTAATITGSGLAAAKDALRSGESLQIAVTQVDAGALPDSLTTPPTNDEPFEDDEVLLNWDTLSPTTIFTEKELLDLGVIGANDDDITWEELKYLYHYMTPEEIDFLWSYINSTQAQYADTQLLAWLDEMIDRDGVELPFTYNNLLDYADFTDEQIGVLTKPDGVAGSDYPTIGQLRQAGLTLEQMQLLQSNAEELREGTSAEEQAEYDALLSWLEDAIAQKELEKENATITSMTLNGLEEYADLTDKQMQILSDMGLQNLDNPSIGQIKKLDLTLEQMELLYAEIDRARSAEYIPAYQAEYDVLLNWLEEAISEKEQENKDAPTYINVGGEQAVFVGAVEVDVKAVKVSGSTRNIEILADRSNAVQWSTNISSAALEEMLESAGKTATGNTAATAVRAYKVLEDGRLEAKAAKVTVNADGTLTLSAMSDGNSTYIFVLEPNRFTDLHEKDWYYDEIMTVNQRLLMSGVTADTFAPEASTSRGMIATILYRIAGEPPVTYTDAVTDVADSAYYFNAVHWAASNGIMSGYGNGIFGADDPITREQLAAMLYNYAVYAGYDVSVGENTNILSYNDAFDITEYAFSAMQWACGAGIIHGRDGGMLVPQGYAKRGEAAAMLVQMLD